MASSVRQAIACIFLLFATVVDARSQSGPEKRPGATFTGKVTVKGKGVPGVAVGMVLIEASMQQSARHRTFTDDQGNFRITNVGPGKYQVTIAAPGFVVPSPMFDPFTNKTFLVSKSETVENVDFALVRGGVITGKVSDADGRPLIEEEISLIAADLKPGNFYMLSNTRTDDRGIYRMFGIRPGKYRVAAGQDEIEFGSRGGLYKRTFHPAATEASQATIIEVSEGSEVTNVDITLAETVGNYSASGRIVDGDTGQPLANLPYGVHKQVENSGSSISTGAGSSKDGEFKLDNLSPGEYSVFVTVPPDSDYRVDYVPFKVVDRDVTGLVVKATRGASVSGVIVLEGTPDKTIVETFRKSALYGYVSKDDAFRTSTPSSTINPDGSFRIGGLQAGVVTFGFGMPRLQVVRIERGGVVLPQGVELKEREQITGLRLFANYANGTIQGVVKLDGGPIPATGRVIVSLKRLEDFPTPFSSSSQSAPVDARGQFFAEGLFPGTYEITANYAPEPLKPWRRTTQQVVVTNGAVANVTLNVDSNANPGRP